jgi:hypothetical protein
MSSFFLLLIAILPRLDGPVTDRVDLVEVNHFFNENADPVFSQLIFQDWQENLVLPEVMSGYLHDFYRPEFRGSRYMTVDWRLIKTPQCLPIRDWENGGYVMTWMENGVIRQVRANEFRETWLQYDVELHERAYLSKELRRGLKKP